MTRAPKQLRKRTVAAGALKTRGASTLRQGAKCRDAASSRVRVVTKPASDEPEFAMVPWEDWTAMQERLEDFDDITAAKRVQADLAAGGDELIPIEIADRLVEGETPIKIWRAFRGKTQAQLAAETGLDQGYISELESGRKSNPTASVLRALADVLEVTIDDLVA